MLIVEETSGEHLQTVDDSSLKILMLHKGTTTVTEVTVSSEATGEDLKIA